MIGFIKRLKHNRRVNRSIRIANEMPQEEIDDFKRQMREAEIDAAIYRRERGLDSTGKPFKSRYNKYGYPHMGGGKS